MVAAEKLGLEKVTSKIGRKEEKGKEEKKREEEEEREEEERGGMCV